MTDVQYIKEEGDQWRIAEVCVPASALEESGGCSIGGAGERPGALVELLFVGALAAAVKRRQRPGAKR